MTLVGFLAFTFWISTCAFAYVLIRDPLSPDKLMLSFVGLFFSAIFFETYDFVYIFIFVCINIAILIGILIGTLIRKDRNLFQSQHTESYSKSDKFIKYSNYSFKLLWVASAPALFAQLYLISIFGGVDGYINVIALRVVEFRGLGPLRVLINTFFIINVIYFSLMIACKNRNFWEWALFCLHFTLLIGLALLSGSRGTLLLPLVIMVIVFHYSRSQISIQRILFFAVLLIGFSMVLGEARQGVRISDGEIRTGLADRSFSDWFKTSSSYYGLIPLQLVLESEGERYYGFTYLTAITNFVPRAWWPDKPDTGGVILTKEYTLDAWGGYSNLSTGIIPEAIINFGLFGVPFGLAVISVLITLMVKFYFSLKSRIKYELSLRQAIAPVYFGFTVWGLSALLVGEFTNVIVGLTLNLVTIFAVSIVLRLRLRPHYA
jgi:oligosaccharide repeat unit polymerase